ncbi:MAG TPA: glutamine synthetase family protein [Gaiellaceae bacterium]|jgi:glutamine synthetase|nr:glutamine synthetase family protein [Gaiellaceae bacterium]
MTEVIGQPTGSAARGMLSLEELRSEVERGTIDTVLTCFTDMQGRLMGKRVDGEYFLGDTVEHGVEGCNYLLALDMEMDPVPGYAMANWEQGYGDFHMVPDFATLRRIPWLDRTALVLCDVEWEDGSPVVASPRQVLKRQVERAVEHGYMPMFASELEFYLLKDTYADANTKHYRDLTPTIPYILDYHILATTFDEDVIGDLRRNMRDAGIPVEFSKGEAWPGQHELNFRFADALTTADRHVVYKNGAKEIAHQHGQSITFMAKPDHTWIGSSCHIHTSLWAPDGSRSLFPTDDGHGPSAVFNGYLGGLIAAMGELSIFVAPNVNSYKRYAAESWAPTTLAWSRDNRTCGFRVVGHGNGFRIESRIPGADANPYLAFAAMLAAGLHGLDNELEPPPMFDGNAYTDPDLPRVPSTLRDAIDALERSTLAREAFGDEVVDHYLNYARTEQRLFDETVTCYERERLFERA